MLQRIFCVSVLLVAACGSTKKKDGEAEADTAAPDEKATLRAPLDSELPSTDLHRTSRSAAFLDMIDELAEADVVCVGERHDQAAHHAVQLKIIEYLYDRGRLHGIGMEMFQRRFQPALDDYVEGRIGEEEMLERTEWKKRWNMDFGMYRPILAFARKKRVPVVALNVEDEIRAKVREGGLDGLPDAERRGLPAIDLSDAAHRAYIRPTFHSHPGMKMDFDRYYLLMCLWDQVMADSIVRWYRTAPDDAQMVVIAGAMHVGFRYGITKYVRQRAGKKVKVVIPVTEGEKGPDLDVFAEKYADFVWLVPPSGKG